MRTYTSQFTMISTVEQLNFPIIQAQCEMGDYNSPEQHSRPRL